MISLGRKEILYGAYSMYRESFSRLEDVGLIEVERLGHLRAIAQNLVTAMAALDNSVQSRSVFVPNLSGNLQGPLAECL